MADRSFSNDELRLYELMQQFLALSDDKDVAGTIILIGPRGTIVGDATLAAGDIEAATDALLKLNIQRANGIDPAAAPLLPEVDADDVTEILTGFEKLLGGE